jgi:hypothetical protein
MRSSLLAVAVAAAVAGCDSSSSSDASRFSDPRTIDNQYLPLTKHRRCEHRGRETDGTRTRSVTTVLRRTKRFVVDGKAVDAAVIRDNAYEDGKLVETTLDYFAQADEGTVHYFGEDVVNIRNGRVLNRRGTWLYGRDTDVLGVAMPPAPRVGQQFRFEDVPGVTTESNRVEETGLRSRVRGRTYTNVVRIQEFIQPEGEIEYKLYAPGVGKIVEYPPGARAELVRCR